MVNVNATRGGRTCTQTFSLHQTVHTIAGDTRTDWLRGSETVERSRGSRNNEPGTGVPLYDFIEEKDFNCCPGSQEELETRQ